MNYDQMIEVIQAEKDGKKIEVRTNDTDRSWSTRAMAGSFNFSAYEYRVKKEPRVIYARIKDDGRVGSADLDPRRLENFHKEFGGELVKFIEVIEE